MRVAVMASFAPNMSWNLHAGELELESKAPAAPPSRFTPGGNVPSRLVVPLVPQTGRAARAAAGGL